MNQPIAFLLGSLVKSCDIVVDYRELEFQLMSHPSYPSLHAITGVLDHFKVSNLAIELPTNEESFAQLPDSFLTRITNQDGVHFVFVKKNDVTCQVIFDKRKVQSFSVSDFISSWTGIVIIVEKNAFEEPTKKPSAFNFNRLIAYLSMAVLVMVPFWLGASVWELGYFLLAISGLAFSAMIVMQELGIQSVALDKFCGTENSLTSCDQVLHSAGAKFFGRIKLSEIALIYFSGLTLSWLVFALTGSAYNLLFWPSVLALPVTIYSIYYQLNKVKKWCMLCLSVVVVLWLQGVWAFLFATPLLSFFVDQDSMVSMVICFLFSAAFVQLILPKFKKEQELKKIKIEHIKFKRNYNLFSALIGQSRPIATAIDESEIVLGSVDKMVPLEVVIVTNPLCGHCKSAHELVAPLLERFRDRVKLCIRFSVRVEHPEDVSVRIAARLLEIYHTESEEMILEALHDAYGQVQIKDWLGKWGEHHNSTYLETLKMESSWCGQNGINFTPEILVNGRSFPNDYERVDLLYFIEDLIEEYESQARQTAQSVNDLVAQSYT